MQVSITVNGEQRTDEVEPRLLLAHYLREVCGLNATNIGCDSTSCGACTVIVDGLSVKSCTVLAAQTDGAQVTTLEGLAGPDGELHPVQRQRLPSSPSRTSRSVGSGLSASTPMAAITMPGVQNPHCRP